MKDSGLDFDFWPKAGFGLAHPDQELPFALAPEIIPQSKGQPR